MDTARFDRYVTEATELFNAGFTSKAAQKRAIDNLNRAYDLQKGAIHDILLAEAERGEGWNELYWGLPDLHNWKPRHSEQYKTFALQVVTIEQLVELRNAVKTAEITPPAKSEIKVIEERVIKSIRDLLETRREQFLTGCRLVEVFGKLPVSINAHYVTNAHGTTFIRCFYYVNGRLTPLNTIICVLQTMKDREA